MRSIQSRFSRPILFAAALIVLTFLPSICMAERYLVLHQFFGSQGVQPRSALIVDPSGNLYGTTTYGGHLNCTAVGLPNGCGTVYKVALVGNRWTETVLYAFNKSDGAYPVGGLVFDTAGNLYGTTSSGGDLSCNAPNGCGSVFKLTPNSDGSWTRNTLHNFTSSPDGFSPSASLVFDAAGNLYGTTSSGGLNAGYGTVFKLSPNSNGTWTETVLHSFTGADGSIPVAGLIFDPSGNLYGTASTGGQNGAGVVYKLAPNTDGSWTESVLHSFTNGDGQDPFGGVVLDAAGNLYGTTMMGGPIHDCSGFCGVVYKLSQNSGGGWTETVLHAFGGGPASYPAASLTFDASGNLYGTASGYSGPGAVFRMTPVAGGKWSFATVFAFPAQPAFQPDAPVVFDQAGNLYGTTAYCGGGSTCSGVVFKIIP